MTLFSDHPDDEGLPGPQRLPAMLALMVTTAMGVFDGSMINIALPQMAQALNSTAANAVWIANSYLLAVAMSLAIFSALAVRYGFRNQFIAGLVVFSLSSLGCAMSTSLEMLVTMRFIQGIGGAATLSIVPAMLRSIFPNRLLGQILGMNALLIASCTAAAPLFSGMLLVSVSWPWLFAINLPLGLLATVLALRYLPASAPTDKSPFDYLGALLSALTLGCIVLFANSFSSHVSNTQALYRWGYALIALFCGIGFIVRQRRFAHPLMPLNMFSNRRFSLAAGTSCTAFVAQGMTFIALPFLYEGVYGYSSLMSALLFVPWPLGIILAAPQAGKLADKQNPALISSCGLLVFGAGLELLAMLPSSPSVWDICLRSFVCGVGFGLFQSPNNREMLGNAPREYSSYASGVLAIMRTFGQSLGSAFIGVILSLGLLKHHGNESMSGSIVSLALWSASIAVAFALVLSLTRLKHIQAEQQSA